MDENMGVNDHINRKGKSLDSAKPAQAVRWNDVKFVKRELTTDETITLKSMDFTAEDLVSSLEKYAEEYRISFKWDAFSKSPACFWQPIDNTHENAGYCLVGRGSSFIKAFKQAQYKHEVLGRGEAWKQWDDGRAFDFDD